MGGLVSQRTKTVEDLKGLKFVSAALRGRFGKLGVVAPADPLAAKSDPALEKGHDRCYRIRVSPLRRRSSDLASPRWPILLILLYPLVEGTGMGTAYINRSLTGCHR